jgi:hypothetical protein
MVEKRVYPPIPKYFNTTGPCEANQHYMVPPLPRVPEAPGIVAMGGYFVLHAPRQSGKTTFLRAFARSLTAGGDYAAVYMSCEAAEAKGDDEVAAQRLLTRQLIHEADAQLPAELRPGGLPADLSSDRLLTDVLSAWCARCPRRVVLLLDEIDALRGQSLIAVLRQLRAGFPDRPHRAPWSVMLCGLRDVRDYKLASGGDAERLGTSSPFNVKLESLTLGTFSDAEVQALLLQHTEATGQVFSDEARARLTELAGGQPWLVNALAWEIVSKMRIAGPIERSHVETAKERLILARATHLDSLTSKLAEPRVRRVIGPLLSGELPEADTVFDDDVSYVVDLGLVKNPPLRVANEIYREVIARVLSAPVQTVVTADPRRFVRPDGRFDLDVLLTEFAAFWVEQGESMVEGATYAESGAQLVLMAYLQRVVNGGGVVGREYGIGRRRIDLLIEWPYTDAAGKQQLQREAIELKVWREGRPDPLPEGLKQLDEYLERVGLPAGVLVLFDRRKAAAPIEERVREEHAATKTGRPVRVLRA